jgi:hypothetical protein
MTKAKSKHCDNVRFQLLVNGVSKCFAGVDSCGVLVAGLDWVKRDPAKNKSGRNGREDKVTLHLGGANSRTGGHLIWIFEEMNVGDEVTIRILPPGKIDEPTHPKKKRKAGND